MKRSTDVVVIGAGISGLACAYYYKTRRPQHKVIILDKNAKPGGLIQTNQAQDYLIENAADCFISKKTAALDLCAELGLCEHIVERRKEFNHVYLKYNDNLHKLSQSRTGIIAANLDTNINPEIISDAGRARLAEEPNIPVKEDASEESVASFFCRRLGQEAYGKVLEPLLAGIYAGEGHKLSIDAVFNEFRQLELQYGSILNGLRNQKSSATSAKYSLFASFRSGMQTLIDALVARLKQLGVEILSNQLVSTIDKRENHIVLRCANDTLVTADKVIMATPALTSARLLADLAPKLSIELAKIEYSSIQIATLGYTRGASSLNFDGYGYVIPKSEQNGVIACTVTSNKWHNRAAENDLLVRVFIDYDDENPLQTASHELRNTLGLRQAADFTMVSTLKHCTPQYNLGHVARVNKINKLVTNYQGLHLIGAAFKGLGIPDCIGQAKDMATKLTSSYAHPV